MKILHTSDWHLGKRLFGRERLAAQRAFGEWLIELVRHERISLVLVAGDVFDTATPSSEAENLFYDLAGELGESADVVVVSGNHDDPERLGAAGELARRHNIVIAGGFGVPLRSRAVTAAGEGWLRLGLAEPVNLVLLPYPSDARTGDVIREGETYADRVRARLGAAAAACFDGRGRDLIVSHLFCTGAEKSGSERDIELGTARLVPLDCFPACDYAALGHIHKYMRLGPVCYCGAPMPFTFEEREEKFVVVYDTAARAAEKIPVPAFDTLAAGTFPGAAEAAAFLDAHADALCQITLELDAPLAGADFRALRARRNLVRMIPVVRKREEGGLRERAHKSTREILREFCEHCRVEATDELLALFLSLCGED